MWKKNEEEQKPQQEAPSKPLSPVQQLRERAIIGHAISVQGDITGQEDLQVHGKVEGKITLGGQNVTVGRDGHVKADITAKIISVEGRVQGNLRGEEQVLVRKSGSVEGNISSPRVSLEDGCRFTGHIDMAQESSARPSKPIQARRPEEGSPKSAAV